MTWNHIIEELLITTVTFFANMTLLSHLYSLQSKAMAALGRSYAVLSCFLKWACAKMSIDSPVFMIVLMHLLTLLQVLLTWSTSWFWLCNLQNASLRLLTQLLQLVYREVLDGFGTCWMLTGWKWSVDLCAYQDMAEALLLPAELVKPGQMQAPKPPWQIS